MDFQQVGNTGGVDKHGLISVVVPFWAATLSEAIRATPDLDIGLPLVSRQFRQADDGGYDVTCTFEGADDKNTDKATFELDGSMTEDPIQTHPAFEALKKKYGWDDAEKRFNENMPSDSSSGGLASGNSNSGPKKSKMWGVQSWLVPGAIYRVTYVSKVIPASIFSGIGTVQTPPNIGRFNLPNLGKRNWLKLAPKVRMRGDCIEITLEFMLSGPEGWITDVYGKSVFGESGSNSSGLDDTGDSGG